MYRYWLAGLLKLMGQLPSARQELEASLQVRRELGEKLGTARCRLSLAELSLDEGHPLEAESAAREIAQLFRQARVPEDESRAEGLLARALFDQGKVAESRQPLAAAVACVRQSEAPRPRLWVAILDARLRGLPGGSGERDRALQNLEGTRREAGHKGYVGLELEARLASGEIGIQAGRAGAAAELEALEKEASAKGFGLIARKAAAARQPSVAQARLASER